MDLNVRIQNILEARKTAGNNKGMCLQNGHGKRHDLNLCNFPGEHHDLALQNSQARNCVQSLHNILPILQISVCLIFLFLTPTRGSDIALAGIVPEDTAQYTSVLAGAEQDQSYSGGGLGEDPYSEMETEILPDDEMLTVLGSHSSLTMEDVAGEYEWVKTNLSSEFMSYVIPHAYGNPNVVHFLYEYGHGAESPDSFTYTYSEINQYSGTTSETETYIDSKINSDIDPGDVSGTDTDSDIDPGDVSGTDTSIGVYTESETESSDSYFQIRQQSLTPLLMQWDYRWGFDHYGGGPAGLTACAPTCMAMIGLALTGDRAITPRSMCEYSLSSNYWVSGQGTSWDLAINAFPNYPIDSQRISVDQYTINSALQQEMPVLINVGVGKFSAIGHFMVLAGITEDGNYILNDPNNLENCQKTWTWDELNTEILAAWSYKYEG